MVLISSTEGGDLMDNLSDQFGDTTAAVMRHFALALQTVGDIKLPVFRVLAINVRGQHDQGRSSLSM